VWCSEVASARSEAGPEAGHYGFVLGSTASVQAGQGGVPGLSSLRCGYQNETAILIEEEGKGEKL
jgi:hypothetical protein